MRTIYSSAEFENEVKSKDLLSLIKSIEGNSNFEKCHNISFNRVVETPDLDNKLMTNIVITFQTWNKKEIGKGTYYEYHCNRAIDFCCSNSRIIKINK